MPRFRIAPRSLLLMSVAALTVTGVLATTPATSVAAPTDEVTGTLAEQHGDDFARGTEVDMGHVIESGNKIVRVKLPKGAKPPLGQRVRLKGHYENTALGKTLEVTSTEPVPAAALQAVSPGSQTVAVLLVNFSNSPQQPWTTAYARGVMFTNSDSVNALYQATSDGAINLSGEVFGWYTLPMHNGSCDYNTVRTQARAAATAAGVNLAAYKHTVYAFPNLPCGWAGLANVPGTSSWINGAFFTSVVGHELGHNFGAHHSSTLSCNQGTGVTLSDFCTASEYGDPFSVMGSGNIHVDHNYHRAQFGWMQNQTVTTTGTYQLAPANGPFAAAPRYIQIPRGDGTYFHLELRKSTPIFDNYAPTAPVVNGVSIRLAPSATSTSVVQSKLLDTTPTTSTFTDSALLTGKTFHDQYGANASNVKITTTAVSPSGATISVEFAGSPPPATTTTTTTTAPPTTTTTTTTAPPTTTTTTTTTTAPPTTTTTAPPAPPGTPAFVKTVASGQVSQAGNWMLQLTVPAGNGVATGHRVVVAAGIGTSGGMVSCSDNRGNKYTVDGRSSANNLVVCSAHVTKALAAGDTIVLIYPTFSGVSQAIASAFSGIAATAAVDGTFRAGSSTSTNVVSVNPALTTSTANDLLFAAAGSSGIFTASTGFSAAGGLGTVATAHRPGGAPASWSIFGAVTAGAWRSLLIAYRATTTTAPPTSTTTTTTAPPTTTTTTTTAPPTTTTTTTTAPPTTTTTAPPAPPGTPAFVNTVASGQVSQAGNWMLQLTVPAGNGVALGHRVVVAAGIGTSGGMVSCSDNRGNKYTVDGRSSANNLVVCSAHVTKALAAGDTIVLIYPTFSGVSQAIASAFSGIAATAAVDGTFRAGSSTSTNVVSVNPALTTSTANDLLFAAAGSSGVFTASTGFSAAGGLGTVATAHRPGGAPASWSIFGAVTAGAWRSLLIAYRAK